jgi:hypothetical protein
MEGSRFGSVSRDIAQILGVALLAGLVGAGIGTGLGELVGDDTASGADLRLATEATTATAAPAPSPAPAGTPPATTPSAARPSNARPRVRVLAAVLYPAATSRGQSLQRASVRVRLRMTAPEGNPLPPARPSLLTDAGSVLVDPAAADLAGALLSGVRPGVSATGELRFETAGATTIELTTTRKGRLRIAGRTVPLTIEVSPAPAALEITDCQSPAGTGIRVTSAAGMTCAQGVREMRGGPSAVSERFTSPGGFVCQRVAGNQQRGQWRCSKGTRAFRFELSRQ